MSIKVAIAGVGGFGSMYVDHFCRLAEAGRVELVAAAEFSPKSGLTASKNCRRTVQRSSKVPMNFSTLVCSSIL